MDKDIYRRAAQLERRIQRIRDNPALTNYNRKTLLEFHRWLVVNGIGIARQLRNLETLYKFGEWLGKDFSKTTKDDIMRVLSEKIENNNYEEWTKATYRKVIKRFYKWLDADKHKIIIAQINGGKPKKNKEKKWVLITEAEVQKMIETADTPRNQALFAILWESGARIAEILTMQIRHVVILEDGAVRVSFEGKTGVRTNKLWMAAPYLREWIRQHPLRNKLDEPLWISTAQQNRHKQLSYNGVTKIIDKTAVAAGVVSKDLNPHAWRHARATFLASKGWSEQQLCKFLGWEFGSEMPRIYIDRAGVNVDNAIDSLYGVLPKQQEVAKDKPLRCVRCKELVGVTMQFCPKCGMPMTQESAQQLEEARQTSQDLLLERITKLERAVKAR